MSVYVDELFDYGWKLGPSCHLVADTEEELHEFALSLGMKRDWFQCSKPKAGLPHYDLTARRRMQAIKKGAIALNRNQFVEMVRKRRNGNREK